jgi:hypothetical protein
MGRREYSLAIANRTSFLTIASVLEGALGPPSSLSEAGGDVLCLWRRGLGRPAGESGFVWVFLVRLRNRGVGMDGVGCLLFCVAWLW